MIFYVKYMHKTAQMYVLRQHWETLSVAPSGRFYNQETNIMFNIS